MLADSFLPENDLPDNLTNQQCIGHACADSRGVFLGVFSFQEDICHGPVFHEPQLVSRMCIEENTHIKLSWYPSLIRAKPLANYTRLMISKQIHSEKTKKRGYGKGTHDGKEIRQALSFSGHLARGIDFDSVDSTVGLDLWIAGDILLLLRVHR